MPHMHLRGKDFQYTVTYPDGAPRSLLSVPAYDFGWQSYYTPGRADGACPRGRGSTAWPTSTTRTSNPYNPDPNKTVRWGDQTFEEMMIGYIDVDVPVGTAVAPRPPVGPGPASAGRFSRPVGPRSACSRPATGQAVTRV